MNRTSACSALPARPAAMVLWIWIAAASSLASGQTAGRHRGLFVGYSGWGNPAVSALGQVSSTGAFSTWTTTASGPWPYWGDVRSATQDVDNHGVIVPAWVGRWQPTAPDRYAFAVWDPTTRAVTTTLWSALFNVGIPRSVTNTALDSNGDLVGGDWYLDQLVRFDRAAGAWSTITISPVTEYVAFGGLAWDKLHGGFYHASSQNGFEQALYYTTWDLQKTSLVASAMSSVEAIYGGDLLEDGTWVSSSSMTGTYAEVPAGLRRWRVGPLTALGLLTDVTAEKYAAPGRSYYAAYAAWYSMTNSGLVHVDATTTPHTVSTVWAGPWPGGVLGQVMEVLPLFQRDLATVRAGRAVWDVRINPGGGALAGKPFVIAASLAGASPPLRLADGRELFITPDWLTARTAQGPWPPLLTGNVGYLDGQGRARARLDLSALGTAMNGQVIHFAALVLDPGAPSGVGWVCDPWAFVADVQP